ncbi:hypothetical protein MUU74_09375 [Chryseobacterium daecheongense]|uniref:hypothetical protein n=1 Tax=Chryseobacterium daecheongense TaxID=192389 RepID=UPI001FD712E2|nr:hypothetical protein [Chryseobacterium daecheongense]UOU96708.1 hypothetical protein MUU74_09375 [Chryseobacterium daecheongense]
MNNKKNIFLSFLIYGLGLLALLISDLYVNQSFSSDEIADYTFIKSSIFILGGLSLMGYEQVFIRDLSLIKREFTTFLVRTIIISLIFCYSIFHIKNYSPLFCTVFFFSIIFFSLLSYYAASYRAEFKLIASQVATNLWKIFFLLLLVLWVSTVEYFFLVSLLIVFILCFIYEQKASVNRKGYSFELDNNTAKRLGFTFLLSNLTLIFANYGEQFIINIFNKSFISSNLFGYYATYTPIALSMNGFIGFYLGPKIKQNTIVESRFFKKLNLKIFISSLLFTTVSIIFGYLYNSYITKAEQIDFNIISITLLFILCVIRGIYISSSVFLGVYAEYGDLYKVAILFSIITVIYCISIYLILNFFDGIFAVQLILLSSVLNWLARYLTSNFFTLKIIKKHVNG